MPARKPELERIPHFEAVSMAPDSPLKTETIQHAERIMAVRMHMLELVMDATRATVVRTRQYMHDLTEKLALARHDTHEPETPPRRDPHAVSMAQANRAVALGMRVLHDMDRLREAAYRQAREAAYRRTGQRVGPVFWSDTGADLPPELDTSRSEPEPPARLDLPQAEPVTETAAARTDPAETPGQAQSQAGGKTLTKRLMQLGQDRLERNGVSRRSQVELARRARQQRWSLEKFNAEVEAAIQARA